MLPPVTNVAYIADNSMQVQHIRCDKQTFVGPGCVLPAKSYAARDFSINSKNIQTQIRLPPACFASLKQNSVHFARSTLSHLPVQLNGGKGGYVIMRPLSQLERCHFVAGGRLTRRRDRHGIRVRESDVRYGIVRDGTLSCDSNGCINARTLNNDSHRAVTIAKKLFYEVHGSSIAFTTTTATNASTVIIAVSANLRWIADSGAFMDFIGKNQLSSLDKSQLIRASDPKKCNTGNGIVSIDKQLRTQ